MQNRRGKSPALAGLAVIAALLSAPAAPALAAVGTPLEPAAGVPGQGRAWELVTLPESGPTYLWFLFAISEDGSKLYYDTAGSLPDNPGGEPPFPVALAERGPHGWTRRTVLPPTLKYEEVEAGPAALTPNFGGSSLWESDLLGESGPGLFRGSSGGGYELLVGHSTLLGTSTDLHHVLVSSERHLLPADAGRTAGRSLYEIVGSELRLVDVDDEGALLSECGASAPGPNPISRDGRRVFFGASPGCAGPASVYMREDGATTTRISASQCDLPDCGPAADATFAGADPSGSRAYLVSDERLVNGDADDLADLYRYDVASGDLSLLSDAWPGGELRPATEAARVPAQGSRVYFVATEETAPGAFSGPRLYLAGGGGVQLVSAAAPNVHEHDFMQVSDDGRYALFETAAALVQSDADAQMDVYRYDADDGSLTRVSAGPAGGNAPFEATIQPTELAREREIDSHPYRAMSSDGSRVFFTTAERLLAEDRNDAADVYELAAGELALISPGVGSEDSQHAGTTPDGTTAIFGTAATLLPVDRDHGDVDVYAARIGGGFPAPPDCAPGCRTAPRGRSERAEPATAGPPDRRIRTGRIDAAARRRAAATGWIVLLAEAPEPGRLAARARAKVGARVRTVAATAVRLAQPGPVQLRMRLSPAARRQLEAGGDLRVRLLLRHSRLDSVRRIGFQLRPGP